jgi:hypothetical protein
MSAVQQLSGTPENEGPATPVYRTTIVHSSAWKVADFKSPADYTIEFTAGHLRDIERAIR